MPHNSPNSNLDSQNKPTQTITHEEPTEIEYTPVPGEAQLTARAVVVGCLVGGVVSCTNIYIGLKIGWTFGASIVSAVLGYSLFTVLGSLGKARRLSVLETNITQTAGSAAGSMASAAGLVAPIPAMALLGYEISWPALMAWSLAVAFLGVFFAVPLRRQMVEVDKLRFPTGTATAETILAMASEAGDAGEALLKARVLIGAGLAAGLFALAYHFVPQLESPPVDLWLTEWMPESLLASGVALAAVWSFKIYLGPSLFGAGLLIGPRVVLSLVLGSLVAWGVLGPIAQQQGWAPGEVMSYADGPRGWILWPGVALMVSEAMTALALSWRTFVRALKLPIKADGPPAADSQHIPTSWWVGGLAAGSLLTLLIAYHVFDIPWYLTLVAISLSSILSIVAVRSTGETDINPVGGMGKVTQLVYGGLAPGQMGTNLMAAAITGAGASQAADMMQDLKTGHLLGASPRKQFIAQLFGICAGVLFVVPVYYLFSTAYEIGGDRLPAPAAMAWKAMAELLAEGLEALPPQAEIAVAVAAGCGILLPLLRRVKWLAPYLPSGLAMGIAFIIPAFYSLVMFYGLIIWWIWRKVNRPAADNLSFAVASGLIAGEGLMGMVNAVLTLLGVEPIT